MLMHVDLQKKISMADGFSAKPVGILAYDHMTEPWSITLRLNLEHQQKAEELEPYYRWWRPSIRPLQHLAGQKAHKPAFEAR